MREVQRGLDGLSGALPSNTALPIMSLLTSSELLTSLWPVFFICTVIRDELYDLYDLGMMENP